MNIREAVDKVWSESDVQKNSYPVANVLYDVNARILKLIGRARRIASKEPISDGETFSETFTIPQGSSEHTRTIKDIPLFRVDYKTDTATKWCRIYEDESRGINTWCCKRGCCTIVFFADEKRIFIENGRPGEVRVTYASGVFVPYTLDDYEDPAPPEITWIPEEFQDLIWLYPALRQARYYKPDRVNGIVEEINELQAAFDSHYRRNAQWNQEICTDSPPNPR